MAEFPYRGRLQAYFLSQLPAWLELRYPHGKWDAAGKQFYCANIQGVGNTKSMTINREGSFFDFGNPESKGDFITLYAQWNGITDKESILELAKEAGIHINGSGAGLEHAPTVQDTLIPIPEGQSPPEFLRAQYDQAYPYRDTQGRLLFYVFRKGEGKAKKFLSLCYSTKLNTQKRKFIGRGIKAPNRLWNTHWWETDYKTPYPLYGVEELAKSPESDVLVVEGEKCVHAAREIFGDHVVVVSPKGGSSPFFKQDWSPLYKRKKVIIWPDNDPAGKKLCDKLCSRLVDKVEQVKYINTQGQFTGWDIADALKDGWDFQKVTEWLEDKNGRLISSSSIFEPSEQANNTKQDLTIPEDYAPSKKPPSHILRKWKEWGVDYSSQYIPYPTQDNAIIVLEHDETFKNAFFLDEFSEKINTNIRKKKDHSFAKEEEYRMLTDKDERAVVTYFQRHLNFMIVRREVIHDAILDHCENFKRHLAREHIMEIVKRNEHKVNKDNLGENLRKFFPVHYGEELTDYVEQVGIAFWCSIIAKILENECHVHFSVVLEGRQGDKKSFSLEVIGDKWYGVPFAQYGTTEFETQCKGFFVVESPEFLNFEGVSENKKKGILTQKNVITTLKYANNPTKISKGYVIVCTTNDNDYLKDTTGNRRWYPIHVNKIVDLEKLREAREILITEAYLMYEDGYEWYEEPDGLQTVQDRSFKRDIFEEKIRGWLIEWNKEETSLYQIAHDCLNMTNSQIAGNRQLSNRIGKILRRLYWRNYKTKRQGVRVVLWIPMSEDEIRRLSPESKKKKRVRKKLF